MSERSKKKGQVEIKNQGETNLASAGLAASATKQESIAALGFVPALL